MGLGKISDRSKMALFLATVVAYVIIGATVFSLDRQNREAEERRKLAEVQSQASLAAIQKATNGTARLQVRNTELQERLLAMSREIASLAQAGIRTTTGGDSFAYIHTWVASNTAILSVAHRGRYPLYEVKVRIYDQTWPEGSPPHATFAALKEFPVIPPHAFLLLHGDASGVASGGPDLSHQDEAYFVVSFTARNGGWMQQVKLRRVGEQWQVATQVTRRVGRIHTILLEWADAGFPRTDKIRW
jgi:hypothetical protein